MKERLYTIELTDAIKSGDECPFCYIERNLEHAAIEFVLGSSYMESDIREKTDRQGFCRKHTKMMYDYGNTLGNAWIIKSRLEYLRDGLKARIEGEIPEKAAAFWGRKKVGKGNGISSFIRDEESHCYICGRIKETYDRVQNTFVYMMKHEKEFLQMLKQSRGCCINHFAGLMEVCERDLNQKEKEALFPVLFSQLEEELRRIQGDIDWMIEKYDYRNADADWKSSRDAVQRAMQKIVGGYPAAPVFKSIK